MDYLALDAGQCALLARAGTEFLLFEDQNFKDGIGYEAIQTLLRSDVSLHIYLCRRDDHEAIMHNAFSIELFSVCADDAADIPAWEYCPAVTDGSTVSPGVPSWPPRSADDPRLYYTN